MPTYTKSLFVTLAATLWLSACGGGGGGGAVNSGPPTLASITITPADPSVRYTQTQQLSANGNYSDGSTQDLTGSVTWSSSDIVVASVVSGGPDSGLVTGNKVGSVTLSAKNGMLTGNAILKVIGSVSLPKTGQTTCYDPAGAAAINCAGTGQDGEILAGKDWPQPRFVSGTGAAVDCVTDTLTGLMWTQDGNLPATTHPGPLNGKRSWQAALNYPQNLSTRNYCGFADWRLPNVVELESLVDSEAVNQADNLNAQGFINVQGSGPMDASGYWTSTSNSVLPGKAWGVDMHNGCVGSCHLNTDQANYVWPVRGPLATAPAAAIGLPRTGQTLCYDELGIQTACAGTGQDGEYQAGVAWPSSRFAVDTSGLCITDNLTGLMWAQNANATGRQTLVDALDYVTNTLCNFSDWRLPNRKEMFSLMFNGGTGTQLSSQWLEGEGFGNVGSASCYWTSTNVDNGAGTGWEAVWYVHPDDSHVEKRNKLTTPDCSTWPVRGGRR